MKNQEGSKYERGEWAREVKPQHAPTPNVRVNRVSYGNNEVYSIVGFKDKESADRAWLAVNSHESLLKALKELTERVAKDAEKYAPEGNEPVWAFIVDAADAIAKAEGK